DEEFAKTNEKWLDILVDTVREGMSTLSELPEKVGFIFQDQLEIEEEAYAEHLSGENAKLLMESIINELSSIETIDMEYAKGFMKLVQSSTGIKGKNLFMPVR